MAYRGTFVVNPEGKIKVVELNDNNIGRDASELLRKVEATDISKVKFASSPAKIPFSCSFNADSNIYLFLLLFF